MKESDFDNYSKSEGMTPRALSPSVGGGTGLRDQFMIANETPKSMRTPRSTTHASDIITAGIGQKRRSNQINLHVAPNRREPQIPGLVKSNEGQQDPEAGPQQPAVVKCHNRRRSLLRQIKDQIVERSTMGLMQGGLLLKEAGVPRNMSFHKSIKSITRDTYRERDGKVRSPLPDVIPDEDEETEKTRRSLKIITVTLCALFFLFKTAQPFILDLSRVDGIYPFRPSTTIWVSRIILAIFFYVWCLAEGEVFANVRDWRQSTPYVSVAMCTVINVLAIYLTIEYLGSASYSVLKNLNLPFTAVLMVTWTGVHISLVQWMTVLAITLGLFIYEAQVLERSSVSFGYIWVLVGVVASSCEGILLQSTASKLADVSFVKQSFFYHFYSMILSTILMVCWDYDVVFTGPYGPFMGWSWIVGVYIICIIPLVVMKHAVAGLASAVVVKLIVSATTVSSFSLAVLALGDPTNLVQVLACIQICILLVTYQVGGDMTRKNFTTQMRSNELSTRLKTLKSVQSRLRSLRPENKSSPNRDLPNFASQARQQKMDQKEQQGVDEGPDKRSNSVSPVRNNGSPRQRVEASADHLDRHPFPSPTSMLNQVESPGPLSAREQKDQVFVQP